MSCASWSGRVRCVLYCRCCQTQEEESCCDRHLITTQPDDTDRVAFCNCKPWRRASGPRSRREIARRCGRLSGTHIRRSCRRGAQPRFRSLWLSAPVSIHLRSVANHFVVFLSFTDKNISIFFTGWSRWWLTRSVELS